MTITTRTVVANGFRFAVDEAGGKQRDEIFGAQGTDLCECGVLALVVCTAYLAGGLATAYRVNARAGVSFTFGSIFNNIVNPRFDAYP